MKKKQVRQQKQKQDDEQYHVVHQPPMQLMKISLVDGKVQLKVEMIVYVHYYNDYPEYNKDFDTYLLMVLIHYMWHVVMINHTN